MYWFKRM